MTASTAPRYWNPFVGGLALGVVLFASFLLTGHGLGASGGIARMVAAVANWVTPEHVAHTGAWASLAAGEASPLDHWLVYAVVGTMLGGAVSGFLAGRMKVRIYRGPHVSPAGRLALALIGGTLVGWAARMARGCTSGQALSGGAVLSVGSWVFMMCVFAGGYALSHAVRRLWR